MTEITITTHGVEMPQINLELMKRWIVAVAQGFDKSVGNISYIFCNDDEILEVNRQFLQHDYYTDIITFDYSKRLRIHGDIFISLDTVRSNAEQLGVPYDRELRRVIIHGILHLCGVDDKAPGQREIMECFENQSLDLLEQLKN
ncbi:MAG: rRNA maturation RNase YbeY [Muribaculaceae bacterium]|nr:rRNA maturation RNase YbeY [Muribaculaceae bacterium]